MAENPTSIGRYQIASALGRGSMGVIYKAHDSDIDRPVAIKLIRADLVESQDRADFIARFRREAQAAGRCAHPNIVSIYDFALHEGDPFLAMEFVDGATLAQALAARGRFSPADSIFIMLQVLAALQSAHAMGIVHRDIKPANIMLTGDARVKVTDFGIAKLETSNLTLSDVMVGTPSYMSPEQCRGETVDARSDLFSAGIVLHEILSGQKPFLGRNSAAVFSQLLDETALDLCLPQVPETVRAIVARSLAKAPSNRFASAEEMAAALQAAGAGCGMPHADRTIIMPRHSAVTETLPEGRIPADGFDPEVVDTMTRKLMEILGPIAPHLVRRTARKSDTIEGLCASLAARIDRPEERDSFRQEVQRQITRSTGSTGTRTAAPADSNISPTELARLQTALTRYVGPVAHILIKRAMREVVSASALWQALAGHIGDTQDRAAFLRDALRGDAVARR